MKNLYGIKGIRMHAVRQIDEANDFLRDHDGDIIDIQITEEDIVIIYKEEETR